jgi:uncharacterized zinc-type alcohol dehydrogenase-like protein
MSTNTFRSYAASAAGQPLQPFEFDAGPLGDEEVEIAVSHCGICHSDLSMLGNEWGMTTYPFVPGHEAIGKITALGSRVEELKVGQTIGIGWYKRSCMRCPQCMAGDHNLCTHAEQTIVGHHGGFADRLRCHWSWAIPLPDALDASKAGPLFCGGITVFNPIIQNNVLPTQRVGVIGIGGLGHLALQFLNKWGCEVWAFTSTDSKAEEAKRMGAHHVVNSRNLDQMHALASKLHFVLSTVNVTLDWAAFLDILSSRGKLHFVGAALEPIPVPAFALIGAQKSVSGSPLGSPATVATMLDFCSRHDIAPITEHFPMSKVNDALEHLKAGKARYRIVLENDFPK